MCEIFLPIDVLKEREFKNLINKMTKRSRESAFKRQYKTEIDFII